MIKQVKVKNISEAVYSLAEPIAQEIGLEIWDIRFVKEGPNRYLRIFIDNDSGITIDDCERMSKAINGPLDELDPISCSYILEVCSPGIERELIKDKHFQKYIGSEVTIKFIRPNENNEKEITGELYNFDKDFITIKNSDGSLTNEDRKNISHVNLTY